MTTAHRFLVLKIASLFSICFDCFVGRGGAAVGTLDSQSREPGFESFCCRFESLAVSFIPRCHSSPSCINEYLATDIDVYRNK